MTARILVVDDNPTNLKLLEARLMADYFQVLTASNGPQALEICTKGLCDVVLLDIMMPGMDGFEVCKRLKSDPNTSYLPVVMVTALDLQEDRVRGLDAGADDFLTKPVNDMALIARVKSLARLKSLTDDLRLKAQSNEISKDVASKALKAGPKTSEGRILIVDDRPESYQKLVKTLARENEVEVEPNAQQALFKAAERDYDGIIISLRIAKYDPLGLVSHLRSLEKTRALPIIVVGFSEQEALIMRALDMGVNDYIRAPVDPLELIARVRTQIRRKSYNDALNESIKTSIEMAVRDGLTGLHNRAYLDRYIEEAITLAKSKQQPLSLIMCDIDHFKQVNDTHGHDVGDEVLAEFAKRINHSIRNIDTACRYGGEEFAIIMPDTHTRPALIVAERIRRAVCEHPFIAQGGEKQLDVTVSLGVSSLAVDDEQTSTLFKRADTALYEAKRNGRNQVQTNLPQEPVADIAV